MHWQYTPYMLPLAAVAVLALVLSHYAWRLRRAPGAVPLGILMLAAAAWAVFDVVHLGYADLGVKLFWVRLTYFSAVAMPPLWLVFCREYTGQAPLSRGIVAL